MTPILLKTKVLLIILIQQPKLVKNFSIWKKPSFKFTVYVYRQERGFHNTRCDFTWNNWEGNIPCSYFEHMFFYTAHGNKPSISNNRSRFNRWTRSDVNDLFNLREPSHIRRLTQRNNGSVGKKKTRYWDFPKYWVITRRPVVTLF